MSPQVSPSKSTKSAIRRAVARFIDGTEGAALVEFTVLAPILLPMVVCTMDLGFAIFRQMQVQNAAQAGIQYAIVHGFNSAAITSAVTSATPFTGISASPAPDAFCGCPTSTGVTRVAAPPPCTATCADGSNPGSYVTVSSQGTYNTIVPYPPALIPNSFALTAQATVRYQ